MMKPMLIVQTNAFECVSKQQSPQPACMHNGHLHCFLACLLHDANPVIDIAAGMKAAKCCKMTLKNATKSTGGMGELT